MAFVLKLTDEETDLLRAQAEREHRSMHEVARLAVLERIAAADQDERRRAFIARELPSISRPRPCSSPWRGTMRSSTATRGRRSSRCSSSTSSMTCKVTLGQDEAFDLVIGVVTRRIGVEAAADLLSRRSAPR